MIDPIECLRKIQKNATNRSIVITFFQNCFIQISDRKIGRIIFSKAKLKIVEKIVFFPIICKVFINIFSKHLMNGDNIDIGL